jgi:hypothetical protein
MNTGRQINTYRHLARLYPKSFRDEYSADLVAVFAEHLNDERAGRVWFSTIRDLIVTVPTQHLEVHMNRPAPRTVAVIATCVTVASLILAVIAGTGPVVGVFLLFAVGALVVATLAWKAVRAAKLTGQATVSRWRTFLLVGIALLIAVVVVINVPPYNNRELPGAGWALMMLSLVTSVALITIGVTIGIAQRSTHRAATR